jgi:steroid 5-alpha reductase family enzyme
MSDTVQLILTNLGVMIAVMAALWPISIIRNDPSYIDSIWPIGFIIMAVSSVYVSGVGWSATPVLVMTTIWGLRLGLHLFTRWLKEGPDKRYVAIKARAKFNVHLFVLLYVFILQAILLWLVSLPIQHAVAEGAQPLGMIAFAGSALFAIGLGFETIGDWQLGRFKADPANKGQVMDEGLWRYTRHPNYFGDACVFWGIWLVSVDNGTGWWTAIGPAFLTFTLMKWSGAALLERGLHESRPGYAEYVARTPGFVPWFPKVG